MNGLTFVVPLMVIVGLIAWVLLRSPREDRMSDAWCEKHRTGDV